MTSDSGAVDDARMLVRTVDAKVEDIRIKQKALTGKKGRMQSQQLQEEIDILLKGLQYSVAKRQVDEAEKALEVAKIAAKPTSLTAARFVTIEESEKQPELPSRRNVETDEVIEDTIEGVVERVSTILGSKSPNVSELGPACRGISPAILAHELGPRIKKALTTKAQSANGLRVVEALAFATCLQYQLFPTLLAMFHDSGKKAVDAAISVITRIPSHGRAIVPFLEPLLQSIIKPAGGKWKIKVGALEVLDNMVCIVRDTCPHQTANALPKIVPVLRDCVTDMRAEVRAKAKGILTMVGKMVTCPEVRMMSDDLIECIVDSANMKVASDMLNRLANTTFLHHVDAASFALLFPIVSRAMKERAQETQQQGLMIVGASALLIAEPTVVLPPYLPILLPLVKSLLSEPQIVLQREAAKCVGTLSLAVPHVREIDILPFLLKQLEQSAGSPEMSENDRTGSALGLSEIISQVPRFMETLLPVVGKRVLGDIAESFPERRAGAYSLLEVLAKNDAVVAHLPLVWPWILRGLIDPSALVRDHAFAAGKAIVHEVGAPNADVLLPSLIDAVLTFFAFNGRDLTMQLFSQLCDRLSELRKFGQDLLSMDAITERSRMSLCCLILICRSDSDPAVRRLASLLWKDSIQSGQKAKREIVPTLMKALKGLKSATAAAKVEAATRCIAEMEKSGDFTAAEVDAQIDSGLYITVDWENIDLGANLAVTPHIHTHTEEDDDAETIDWDELEDRTFDQIKVATFPSAWENVSEFLHAFIVSTALESNDAESACTAAMDELRDPSLKDVLESIYHAVFKGYYHKSADSHDAADDHDLVCKVNDLMLMYGGGHLLLKNTTLELRKGQRYGVVGRNGAGKTTLMNLIANGGVAKMPSHVRVVHVHHEQLLMTSDDTCVTFVGKNNTECSPKQLEAALIGVQFPQAMWSHTVNELSGGWRMRLLLASAMIRGADVLLLDEPTNHLDVGAIAWLADYLNTLENAAIMVISHDPSFLDKACTDIIQYSQEKLVYHRGNFSQFKEKLHISEEEAELLIQGNAGDVVGGGSSAPASDRLDESDRGEEKETPVKAETADRKAKITFPVPGKVQGLTSSSKPVMELKNLVFGYNKDARPVLNDISCKLTMNSRVAILGVNGAGKSTLLNLLCQEIHPAASALGERGSVVRHRNCRLAYLAQQHEFHLAEFLTCAPFVYIQKRFQHGWDEALQQRLIRPKNEEEAADRVARAKKHGKYGNEVETLVGRQLRGNDLWYEVKWMTLDDPKQNSWENMVKLRDLGVESFALALDARMQAQAANLDQRPLTQREIVKHMEQFGLTEEMVLNRQIGMFSAGQRSKMTLGAAMWIKPHVIALDEPTNYIDMETLDSLAIALNRFKGAVVTISHSKDFVTRVCTEQWLLEGGNLTVSKCIDAFEKMETR